MRTWTQNELEMLERQVSCWLEKMRIPLEVFRKLKPHNKVFLHDLVCGGTLKISDAQLKDLVKNLLVMVEGRTMELSIDQVDDLTHDELMAFFFPRLGEQLEMEINNRS